MVTESTEPCVAALREMADLARAAAEKAKKAGSDKQHLHRWWAQAWDMAADQAEAAHKAARKKGKAAGHGHHPDREGQGVPGHVDGPVGVA